MTYVEQMLREGLSYKPETYEIEDALGTWVTRVMVTQAIDYLRRKHRFSQLVVNEEQLPDVQDEASMHLYL